MAIRKALLEHVLEVGHGTNHLLRMYHTYGPVRFISVILYTDWHPTTEVLPPAVNDAPVVDADEQMLQILAAGAQGVNNKAGSLGD